MGVNKAVRLSDAIDDYLRHRRSMDLATGTIKQDESTLRQFLALNGNVYCHQLTTNHVTRYFEEGAKTRQPQSIGNDFTRLSVFFKYCRATGRMAPDTDPLFGRRKPRGMERERMRVPVSKFDALLDAAEARSPRDRVAMALLLYTLGRDQEIASIRLRDVDLDTGYIHVTVFKTRREDLVPICEELDLELRKWLRTYTEEVGYLDPGYFLIPSRTTLPEFSEEGKIVGAIHKAYTPDSKVPALGKLVIPALKEIGFPVESERTFYDHARKREVVRMTGLGEGAHTIRRSGARALFDQLTVMGYDGALRVVQSLLHHKHITQTETYIGVTADRRTRDEIMRGRRMYDRGTNVVDLWRVKNGEADNRRHQV